MVLWIHPVLGRWRIFWGAGCLFALMMASPSLGAAPSEPPRYISARSYYQTMRAELLARGGDRSGAVAALRLALVYDPESPEVALRLAELAWMAEEPGFSTDLQRAIHLAPSRARTWRLAGMVRWSHGDRLGAHRAFRQAILVEPRSPDATRAAIELAHLLVGHGRITAAIRVLRDARPSRVEPDLVLARARLYAGAGQVLRALALLERAPQQHAEELERLLVQRETHVTSIAGGREVVPYAYDEESMLEIDTREALARPNALAVLTAQARAGREEARAALAQALRQRLE